MTLDVVESMLASAGMDVWYKNKPEGDHLYQYELQFIFHYERTAKRQRTEKASVMATFGITDNANQTALELPYAYLRGSPRGLSEVVFFFEKWFRSLGTSTRDVMIQR